MREIKFKAWDTIDNKWYEGTSEFLWIGSKTIELKQDGLIFYEYTGLKDKNGVEIYEGDILKAGGSMIFSNPSVQKGLIRIVKKLLSGFTLVVNNDMKYPSIISNIDNYTFWNTHRDWEIIGNIHEPESHT